MDEQEQSKIHPNAELEFEMLGQDDISQQFDCAFRRIIEIRNAELPKIQNVSPNVTNYRIH